MLTASTHDRFGNRWQQNPGGPLFTFSSNDNRIDTYTYDASGNVLSDGVNSYTYDAENRLVTYANTAGATASYVYDAVGRRVVKTTSTPNECTPSGSGGPVYYLNDIFGHASIYTANGVNQCTDEIFMGNRHLATYVQGRTTFTHADWLGTERVRATYNVNPPGENCSSLPFGDGLNCGSAADPGYNYSPLHFTGKERDQESNLDYFGARYNSSTSGRFLSPDAINLTDERVQNPANTLNKYVYGGNNPLKYVDPDGGDITVFYSNGGYQGHFWLVAYDQSTGNSAVLDFGPKAGSSLSKEAAGIAVPGDTNYSSHITSADELKQDFTSLTIQTNPEDTQKAIEAINTYNSVPHEYMTYQQNCTTTCRDVLNKILKLDSTSIRPVSLWGDIFSKWSNAALNQQARSKPPTVQSKHGMDYGRPRYPMNTFDFVWLLLRPQKACVTTLEPDGHGGSHSVTTCN